MDKCLFGQEGAKDQIVMQLVQFAAAGSSQPFALGLKGPPGIGKTSFLDVLARVMQRPCTFFSLGGLGGAEVLVGHNFTYEGSQCGALAHATTKHKCMDGVYFFDELDKLSESPRGQEVANVLLHLTDRAQNNRISVDKYFQGIEMDYSRAFFVFSFNDDRNINPVLLDRMNVINFDVPSLDDKIQIARRHLLPRALHKAGMKGSDVSVDDDVLRTIIAQENREPGVRGSPER